MELWSFDIITGSSHILVSLVIGLNFMKRSTYAACRLCSFTSSAQCTKSVLLNVKYAINVKFLKKNRSHRDKL